MKKKYTDFIEQVKIQKPLVHHITNYVTVNDCANITLSIGASPIMADDLEEVEDIVKIASSLVINIGTLNQRTLPSMIHAGKIANENHIPVIFDPVGAGASKLRNRATKQILEEIKISVLCGNMSEIKFIAGLDSQTKGVDASENDFTTIENSQIIAKNLANRLEAIVAITGEVDVISDGKNVICLQNGHSMLSNITGTGCMCTSLIGAFCGLSLNEYMDPTITALLCMSIAGEIAFEKSGHDGFGSFHKSIFDAISSINKDILIRRSKLFEA